MVTIGRADVTTDDVGNESDPFLSSGLFKFITPPTPLKGGVEAL
jgi:hypothetical protein